MYSAWRPHGFVYYLNDNAMEGVLLSCYRISHDSVSRPSHPVPSPQWQQVLFVAHVVSLFVSFFHVFHLTQTSVAILAVSGLIFLITMHHRREGHLLTQTQEEMVLIFCFGLFWMSAHYAFVI
ncbi:hypothetical protein B0H16DRAFT_611751 [Mycena metata]|uniref:Uncharacterized protein n=1 Tax=Mycena metata TaxID=1033252 RepID=A0AAD7K9X1_9AGAR|nr:hypothetical protein B0H16DRAFT_611751 [Mycena metata]